MVEVLSVSNRQIKTQYLCALHYVITFVTLLVCQWHYKGGLLNISYLYTGHLVIPVKAEAPVLEAELVI
jgi:hypothetical protein